MQKNKPTSLRKRKKKLTELRKQGNAYYDNSDGTRPPKHVWSCLLSVTQRRVNPSKEIKVARFKAAKSNQELQSK